jgi:hypothetical protein
MQPRGHDQHISERKLPPRMEVRIETCIFVSSGWIQPPISQGCTSDHDSDRWVRFERWLYG